MIHYLFQFFGLVQYSFGKLCIILSLLIISINSKSQWKEPLEDISDNWEIGASVGANTFLGDLGGNRGKGEFFIKDFNPKTIKPLIGAFVSYYPTNWISIKASFNYTNVNGADSLIKNTGDYEKWRYFRNLSFRSRIIELNLSSEIYPVMIFDREAEIHKINPYFGIGIGVFHYNPQANLDGKWIYLKPLHLEGEGFPGMNTYEYNGVKITKPYPKNYSLYSVYIPITLGVKYYIDNTYSISAGIIFRHTYTDYVDDISGSYVDPSIFDKYLNAKDALIAKQLYERSLTPWKVKPTLLKANPNNNDSYTTFFITISIRLNNGPKFYYGG